MFISNANIEKAFIGFDVTFQEAFKNANPKWNLIASERPSTDEKELYMWADLIPEFSLFNGARTVINLAGRSQELANEKYQLTIGMDRAKFMDDKYGIYTDAVRQLGIRAAQLPDKLVFDALLNGENADVYDGQSFFSTSHPQDVDNPNSPVMSNLISGCPLSADNVARVMAIMAKYKDSAGVSLGVRADTLLVPPELEYLARQICNSGIIALPVGTAGTSPGGAAGQTNVLQGLLNVVVGERLTSATDWFLLCTKGVVKPFIFQNRTPAETVIQNSPDSPEVFKNDQYQYGGYARGAGGYGPWFFALKATA